MDENYLSSYMSSLNNREIIKGYIMDLIDAGLIPREVVVFGFHFDTWERLNTELSKGTDEQFKKAVELGRRRFVNNK